MQRDKVLFILISLAIILIITGVTLMLIEFSKYYQCTNTTNISWFLDNDCVRYIK